MYFILPTLCCHLSSAEVRRNVRRMFLLFKYLFIIQILIYYSNTYYSNTNFIYFSNIYFIYFSNTYFYYLFKYLFIIQIFIFFIIQILIYSNTYFLYYSNTFFIQILFLFKYFFYSNTYCTQIFFLFKYLLYTNIFFHITLGQKSSLYKTLKTYIFRIISGIFFIILGKFLYFIRQ